MTANDLAEATEGLVACIIRMYVCMWEMTINLVPEFASSLYVCTLTLFTILLLQ